MSPPKTYFYDNADEQARSLAGKISELLLQDIEASGAALLILPGGSSPRKLITLLAQTELPWDKIQITVTDERCVPLGSEHSNAGQITRLFAEQDVTINPIILSEENIKYLNLPASVTMLGMGLDGHIASLFSNQEWEYEGKSTLQATAPFEPKNRISLSIKTLLNTKHLILLVNGQEKWALYQNLLGVEDANIPLSQLIKTAGYKLHVCVVNN